MDLRTVTMDVPPQDHLIVRDNVPARVNAVVSFRVVDPNNSIVEVENAHPVRRLRGMPRERTKPSDPWVSGFLEMDRWMRTLATQCDTPHEPDEAHTRYKDWLPFAHRTGAFAQLTAENLGYDLDHAIQGPPKRPRRFNRGA